MTTVPSPPYVGPAAHTSSGPNKPPTRIVIHGTVSPCVNGGARSIAAYFRSEASGGSAHYVVDPGEVVQVVYDSVIAWHAPPNQYSLGIELCDPQAGPDDRWGDDAHRAMLHRAADLVVGLAGAYSVPLHKIGPADLLAGKHGVCGHVDVSNAWHQSTHTDPGSGFPWPHFMRLVHDAATGQLAVPDPTPHVDANRQAQKSHNGATRVDSAVKDLRGARHSAKDPGRVARLTRIIKQLLGMGNQS